MPYSVMCSHDGFQPESKHIQFSDEGYCIGDKGIFVGNVWLLRSFDTLPLHTQKELLRGQVMAQEVTATGPLLVALLGREILIEMSCKVTFTFQ